MNTTAIEAIFPPARSSKNSFKRPIKAITLQKAWISL